MTTEAHNELENLEEELENEAVEKNSPLAGKSPEELIAMNEEAQKQISRQGNEIGELRRLTDEILRKQLESATPKKPEPEADWDYNPKEATEQLVNSKVDAIEAKLEEESRTRALSSFEAKHPNFRDTSQSDDFRAWVMDSPFRVRMYESGNAGDFNAADELFSEWERNKPKEEKPDNDSAKKQLLKDAKMEKGGGSPNTKKIYRRADIRNLRLNDPQAYEARAEEFHLAYTEGRIR